MFSLPLTEHSYTRKPLSLLSTHIKENYKNPSVGVLFFGTILVTYHSSL